MNEKKKKKVVEEKGEDHEDEMLSSKTGKDLSLETNMYMTQKTSHPFHTNRSGENLHFFFKG